jgi:hypothetical protein
MLQLLGPPFCPSSMLLGANHGTIDVVFAPIQLLGCVRLLLRSGSHLVI